MSETDWYAASEPGWHESTRDEGMPLAFQTTANGPQGGSFCPGGCGCRLGTDDADRFECGCDGGCCE